MKELADGEVMEMLKGVSRSFVLSIRAMPKALRRPVGLAYLLARASDTIADTSSAPVETRIKCLREFSGKLAGEVEGSLEDLSRIEPPDEAELRLLATLPRVIGALELLPAGDREQIVALLKKITHGQELDLVRFPDRDRLRSLESAEELDEYTYLVAGCVGEFWTRICAAHLARYARVELEELSVLGRSFGQGLQLVNILRDLPADIKNGRCYLPLAELRAAGAGDPGLLRNDLQLAAPVFESWRQRALRHLEDGRRYIESIRSWRIRFACLLPWALGVRTLHLIGESSPLEKGERVKVSRAEVTRIMRRAIWAAVSNGSVRNWE